MFHISYESCSRRPYAVTSDLNPTVVFSLAPISGFILSPPDLQPADVLDLAPVSVFTQSRCSTAAFIAAVFPPDASDNRTPAVTGVSDCSDVTVTFMDDSLVVDSDAVARTEAHVEFQNYKRYRRPLSPLTPKNY